MDSGPTSSTPKPASKSKQPREKKSNKSFLNSDSESDGEKEDDNQEQEKEEDDIQDTENVENDAGKTKVDDCAFFLTIVFSKPKKGCAISQGEKKMLIFMT